MNSRKQADPLLTLSPARQLLSLIWKEEGNKKSHSWRRLNDAMATAVQLAIESDLEFHEDDFIGFLNDFNGAYWFHPEGWYKLACEGKYGPNTTAYQAIEKYFGRKPFIITCGGKKIRLYVGRRFDWHIGLTELARVTVTSFVGKSSGGDPYVVACSYKPYDPGRYANEIDKLFRITHQDIKEYHAAIRAHAKQNAVTALMEKPS